MGEWRQIGGLLDGAQGSEPSQFHPTPVEGAGRRSTSFIRQALPLDQEDALSAGRLGFLTRELVCRKMAVDSGQTR